MSELVTIIIPYSIDRGYLNQAIESVKNQKYSNIELLIQNDNVNVSTNINNGIKKAKGKFIKYLCEDDYLTPNSITDSVEAIQGFDFIHGVANNVFPTHIQIQRSVSINPTLSQMLNNNVIHGGTLMFRKSVFDKIGLFNESLVCAEEYEFNLRCLWQGFKLGYTDKILYNYRRHDKQKSLDKGIDQAQRKLRIDEIKQSILNKRYKVVVGIATYKGREESLKKTIKSLAKQCDHLRIYDNETRDIDLTDNGKFFFLKEYDDPIYFFSCDDDIIYPPTYVNDMIQAIEKFGTIVSHHGRQLKREQTKYYNGGHKTINFKSKNNHVMKLDVAGTGVTAFHTNYFNPVNIWEAEQKKMSDLVFSLEAKKQGKIITSLNHSDKYFQSQTIDKVNTIFGSSQNNDAEQVKMVELILNL
jgi:GT2 family glycosyltransferase